jgi:nicotinate-nucleotide adenylyltransferase
MGEFSDLDEVWLAVKPHKTKSTLLDDTHRLSMVRIALEDYPKLKASNVEFELNQPNYIVNTLVHPKGKYPDLSFCLIMGEDNLKSFHKWKNHEVILERYSIYVYPRISEGTIKPPFNSHSKIHKVNAPIMAISSTFIRNSIKTGKNIRPTLPHSVWKYIDEMNFYKSLNSQIFFFNTS